MDVYKHIYNHNEKAVCGIGCVGSCCGQGIEGLGGWVVGEELDAGPDVLLKLRNTQLLPIPSTPI